MNVLHIDCSPRPGSQSRLLSAAVVGRVLALRPGARLVRRDLGLSPIPHVDADFAAGLASPTAAGPTGGGSRLSEELIGELEASDVVVIGSPVNNLTVPSVLKAWIDHVVRMGRTMTRTPTGKVGTLRDRPVIVGHASGGILAGERANQPDFFTPYLTAALGCVGLRTTHFLPLQGTAFLSPDQVSTARDGLVATVDGRLLGLDPVGPAPTVEDCPARPPAHPLDGRGRTV